MQHIRTRIFTDIDKDQLRDRLSEYLNMINNKYT